MDIYNWFGIIGTVFIIIGVIMLPWFKDTGFAGLVIIGGLFMQFLHVLIKYDKYSYSNIISGSIFFFFLALYVFIKTAKVPEDEKTTDNPSESHDDQ
ncbi:hypothetical protein ACFLZH_01435 [Patescibacteria group bacterium]